MSLRDEVSAFASKTFSSQWTKRAGQKVPETEDLTLGNDAVTLEGTVLYADLADSSRMVHEKYPEFSAEVYKTYLYAASRIIRSNGGAITAYDGDRVMGVFIGGSKNTSAAKTALNINYAVTQILQPALETQYPNSGFKVRQRVGIDTSELFIARTGIRGSNDLVWVGDAANRAAKMAALSTTYSSYISAESYAMVHEEQKYGGTPRQVMWHDLGSTQLGFKILGSTWWRSF